MYTVELSKQAEKDKKKLKDAGLETKARELLLLLCDDPFKTPPPYETLIGNLKGNYSRRINIQHRLVYSVDETNKIILVKRMWTHYDL